MATKLSKRQLEEEIPYGDVVFIDHTDSPYTVDVETESVYADSTSGVITVNLPAISSSNSGKRVSIKDKQGTSSTNNITVSPDGSNTIDGASSFVISLDRDSIVLESDGASEWALIKRK